jgi:hypothetical protein
MQNNTIDRPSNIVFRFLFSAEAAKRKFKTLRDQFKTELKKSPLVNLEIHVYQWKNINLAILSNVVFLRDDIQGRKTVGNVTSMASTIRSQVLCQTNSTENNCQESYTDVLSIMDDQNISIMTSPPPTIEQPLPLTHEPSPSCSRSQTPLEQYPSRSRSQTPTGPCNKKSKISAQHELVNIEKEKMEWLKKVTENDNDADKNFLLSLLPQMKNLPPNKLSSFKIKVLTLLHEAAYEAKDE